MPRDRSQNGHNSKGAFLHCDESIVPRSKGVKVLDKRCTVISLEPRPTVRD